MAARSGSGPSLQVLDVPAASGQIAAIGATESEGVFLAFLAGGGIQYLWLSGEHRWTKAGRTSVAVAGPLGLHLQAAGGGDEAKSVHVSFVESSRKAWVCLRVPSAASAASGADAAEAVEVGRASLPAEVAAACSAKGGPTAAVALRSGAVRFLDLSSGKAAGKGLKVEQQDSKVTPALVSLAPNRVALVRGASAEAQSLEFFVINFDEESQKAVLHLQGTLKADSLGSPGPFAGAAAVGPVAAVREDRVILFWELERSERKRAAASGAPGGSFASAVLSQETPKLVPLPAAPGMVVWTCVKGYVAQWGREEGSSGDGSGPLQLTVRDARFGMTAASGTSPLPSTDRRGPLLIASAGGVTLIVGQDAGAAQAVGVQVSLPSFTLQSMIGKGVAQQAQAKRALGPLQELVSGKRKRDDAAVEELFGGERHAATDKALAAALRNRSWTPSLELVNEIVYRRSWAAACALLSLPELDEDLAVKLLSARVELLARVVRRARAPQLLEHALRDNLPASQLPKILEVLLQWLEAYRDFPEDRLRQEAPGLPERQEIITFLGALADGCMPMLAQLEVNLLERTLEAVLTVQKRSARITRLYVTLREAYRIRKPLKPVAHAPVVEVVLLEDF